MAKSRQCPRVGRYGMIGKVASNDLPKPFPGFRNRPVHPPAQSFPDLLELRPHAVPAGLSLDKEIATQRAPAYQDETQECEGLRFPKPALFAIGQREAAKLDQAVLTGCNEIENPCNLSLIASQKRRASLSCWKPTMISSANLTMIMSPLASRRRQRSAQRSNTKWR